jgi:hypothetical protein
MGHQKSTGSTHLQHRSQFTAKKKAHFHIEIGKRLIKKNDLRGWSQSTRQRQALTLPTR